MGRDFLIEVAHSRFWLFFLSLSISLAHPGNPGVASFYEPFATALHSRLQGSMSVRCVNLAGFAPVRAPADAASTAGAVAPATTTAACAHGCAHGHSHGHSHSHRSACDPPAERLHSLQEQCNYLHEYLRALQLQLQCADELARSASTPPAACSVAAQAAQLLSPHLRPGSSTLPPTPTPRQHRFVLVCHSIGAYLGLATLTRARWEQRRWAGRPLEPQLPGTALDDLAAYLSSPAAQPSLPQRRPPVQISHAFLLFPFVRMDLGWLQFHATRTVLAWRWLPRLMARLGRLVPVALYRLVLRLAMRITSEHAVRAVVALARSRALIEQSSFFAHTEFRDVLPPSPAASTPITAPSGPVDPAKAALIPGGGGSTSGAVATFDNSFLGAHVSSTTLYYAGKEHDCWGPQSQMRDFQQQIPGLDARLVPSVTHGRRSQAHAKRRVRCGSRLAAAAGIVLGKART